MVCDLCCSESEIAQELRTAIVLRGGSKLPDSVEKQTRSMEHYGLRCKEKKDIIVLVPRRRLRELQLARSELVSAFVIVR